MSPVENQSEIIRDLLSSAKNAILDAHVKNDTTYLINSLIDIIRVLEITELSGDEVSPSNVKVVI